MTGVIVGVDSEGLDQVRGFSLRTDDGVTLAFTIGALENGAAFPPGHLVEHQATAQPVRVWYRRRAMSGRRSGSRTRPDRSGAAAPASAAGGDLGEDGVELGIRDDQLVGAADDPVPIDGEDPRLGQQAPLVGDVGRLEVVGASRTGWSWPSTSWSWYGSTLMNVTSGCAAATGLSRSRVGPHCALVQNFGVAKTSTNGLWAASASATEVV